MRFPSLLGFFLASSLAIACVVRQPPPTHRAPTSPPAKGASAPAQSSPSGAAGPGAQAGASGQCADPGDRDFSDLFDEATAIEPTSTTVACMSGREADMFRVRAPEGAAGTVLRFEMQGAAELAPKMEVYDANRKKLLSHRGDKSQGISGWIHVAAGTEVYLKAAQRYGVDESYTLSVEAMPVEDEAEPNPSYEQATPISENGSVQAIMSAVANDAEALVDWYKIDVSSKGKLNFALDMSQEVAIKAQLYNANRKKIKNARGGKGERVVFEVPVTPGMYYLELKSRYGLGAAEQGELPTRLTRPYVITTSR